MFEKIKEKVVNYWEYITEPMPSYTSILDEFMQGSGWGFWAWFLVIFPYLLITKQKLDFVKR